MSELIQVSHNLLSNRGLDIIFVHGLGGDPTETWRDAKDITCSWPHWLATEFGQRIGVWSLGYSASPTKWLTLLESLRGISSDKEKRSTEGSMSLTRRADNALDRLAATGIGQRPIVFIAHSLGGLLVKQILRNASEQINSPELVRIYDQCRGVLFLATPHQGSSLANFADAVQVYLPTINTKELKLNNDDLSDLHEWYRTHAFSKGIQTRSYYETKPTKGIIVVERNSADPGVSGPAAREPIPLDKNHLDISKPINKSDQAFIGSIELVETILSREPKAHVITRIKKAFPYRLTAWLVGGVTAVATFIGSAKQISEFIGDWSSQFRTSAVDINSWESMAFRRYLDSHNGKTVHFENFQLKHHLTPEHEPHRSILRLCYSNQGSEETIKATWSGREGVFAFGFPEFKRKDDDASSRLGIFLRMRKAFGLLAPYGDNPVRCMDRLVVRFKDPKNISIGSSGSAGRHLILNGSFRISKTTHGGPMNVFKLKQTGE